MTFSDIAKYGLPTEEGEADDERTPEEVRKDFQRNSLNMHGVRAMEAAIEELPKGAGVAICIVLDDPDRIAGAVVGFCSSDMVELSTALRKTAAREMTLRGHTTEDVGDV